MLDKPRFDRYLEEFLRMKIVDGSTIADSFFDTNGTLCYPWRAQVEAISGKERHTLRLESRSWDPGAGSKLLAAIRHLSWFDRDIAVAGSGPGSPDHHILAEVNHAYLLASGMVSIDRLAAVVSVSCRIIANPPSSDSDSDLLDAIEIFLSQVVESGMPFDGNGFEAIGAECIGMAWGIYEVPESWSMSDVKRTAWER